MSSVAELVVVRAFSHPHEAHLARSVLEAAGLSATVADANLVGADWLYSNAVGGVKVLVPTEDLVLARELLDKPAAVEEGDAPASVNGKAETACPRCGSERTVSVAHGKRWAVLSWLLASVPLFPVWRTRRCRDCGGELR